MSVTRSKTRKSESRLNFRLPQDAKRRIEKAAIASGLTVTDFAISALVETADNILERQERRKLSDRDRDIFLSAIAATATPNQALRDAAREYKRRVSNK